MTRSVVSDYDAQGNRSRITHPDSAYFEYRYDPAGRLTQLTENGPSTRLALLTYDSQGRRDAIGRDTAGAATGFGYDTISRLGAIVHNLDGGGTSNDLTTTFAYNPASQIVTRAQSNNAYEFPVGSANRAYVTNGRNQYTQVGGTTHSWDANGNLTSDGSTSFGYDTENRLTSASGAKSATLTYDPLGRLYQVTSAGVTARFVYDGDRLIAEYNTAGTVQRRYVHGAGVDEPLVWYEGASVSSASRRYLHADHQGSVIATSNAAGAKLGIGTYDAYGVTTAPSTWRFQYTGQAAIPPLGLYYYKARFYNPALGRFMQTDPIGYDDDVNLYAYVGNDPLNKTDPTGTSGTCGSRIEGVVSAGCKSYGRAASQNSATTEQKRTSQSGLGSGSSNSPTPSDTPGSGALDANSAAAVSVQDFANHASGKTLHDLQTEVPGSKLFPNLGAGGPDPSVRYVVDPADPTHVIDMRHFLVVGPRGVAFGYAVEIGQALGFHTSAFNAQDFFSNRVGAKFFNSNLYNPSIPTGVGDQIQNFLLSPGRR